MDMKQIATQVIQNIGGKENIVRATHCATRLRLILKDDTKNKRCRNRKHRWSKRCFCNDRAISNYF